MIMDDPVKALWLTRHYGVRFLWKHNSRRLEALATLQAYESELIGMIRGDYDKDYCRALFIEPAGMKQLKKLPTHEKDALKFLDLWPLEEEKAP